MQDYYEREVFHGSGNTTLQLSLVGTLVSTILYVFAYPSTRLYTALGAKVPMCLGTLFASGGLIAAGQATKICHLYLSFGICCGIGIALLNNVCQRVIPCWFDKRRNIAFGIYGASLPFAGLVTPFIMTPINNSLGASWTFRILGFIFLATNMIACILIKETSAGIQTRKRTQQSKTKCQNIFEANIILWVIQGPIQLSSLYITFTFIPSYATFIGLSDTQGAAVISVICVTGFIGRIIIGVISDRFGLLNTLALTSFISGLCCLLIWMFAYNYGALMAYGVVFGLFSGGYSSMVAPVTASLVGMDRYPTVLSVVITSCGLGCFANTIASAIESASSAEPFLTYKLISGCGYIVASVLSLLLKLRLDRRFFLKI